ncbi:MAG: hypothetical protein ACRCU2_10035, partial [Planktothrix sp.]
LMLDLGSIFDENFYLQQYTDVANAVSQGGFATGFDHFLLTGQFEGRQPSGFYSESYYLQQNPDVANAVSQGGFTTGLDHFLLNGQFEGRDPITEFNTAHYLAHNPDVAAAVNSGGMTALGHYVMLGRNEGRVPTAIVTITSDSIDDFSGDIGEIGQSQNDPIPSQDSPILDGDTGLIGTPLQSATYLGTLTETGFSIQDFVNFQDTTKYYRFTVPENGSFNISPVTQTRREGLEGLSDFEKTMANNDIVVSLIKDFDRNGVVDEPDRSAGILLRDKQDGDLIGRWQSPTNFESFTGGFEAGTYYLRVEGYYSNYFADLLSEFGLSAPFTSANYEIQFDFHPRPSTAPTNPGDSLNTALNLGNLSPGTRQSFTEFVGYTDSADIYSFTNNSDNPVEIRLSTIENDAELEFIIDLDRNGVIDGNDIIRSRTTVNNNLELNFNWEDFFGWRTSNNLDQYYIRIKFDDFRGLNPRSGVNYELVISGVS